MRLLRRRWSGRVEGEQHPQRPRGPPPGARPTRRARPDRSGAHASESHRSPTPRCKPAISHAAAGGSTRTSWRRPGSKTASRAISTEPPRRSRSARAARSRRRTPTAMSTATPPASAGGHSHRAPERQRLADRDRRGAPGGHGRERHAADAYTPPVESSRSETALDPGSQGAGARPPRRAMNHARTRARRRGRCSVAPRQPVTWKGPVAGALQRRTPAAPPARWTPRQPAQQAGLPAQPCVPRRSTEQPPSSERRDRPGGRATPPPGAPPGQQPSAARRARRARDAGGAGQGGGGHRPSSRSRS